MDWRSMIQCGPWQAIRGKNLVSVYPSQNVPHAYRPSAAGFVGRSNPYAYTLKALSRVETAIRIDQERHPARVAGCLCISRFVYLIIPCVNKLLSSGCSCSTRADVSRSGQLITGIPHIHLVIFSDDYRISSHSRQYCASSAPKGFDRV